MPTDLHSLLGCPVEVCHSIFSYLSRADLLTLCLVHGNLRTIVEPLLYANIQLTWEEKSQPHPITSLLRGLLRRPEVATYVSRLSLAGWRFHDSFTKDRAPKILVSEKKELEDCLAFVIKSTTVPYREIWLEELRQRTMDAFVAVLLPQPMRLTDLVIDGDFLWESRFIGLVLRSTIYDPKNACGLRLDVSRLETVSLKTNCDIFRFRNNTRNTADILPFFYLPSVKRISASMDNPVALSWPAMSAAPSPLGLHHLKLEHIREPFLGQLLSTTDKLQSLDWKWYYFGAVYDKQYRTRIVDLAQITESISYARETLSELVISAFNMNDPIEPSLTIQGSMKGLREFKNLTKLTIPLVFLMGAWSLSPDLNNRMKDCLPWSLKSLTITEDLGSNDEYYWSDDDLLDVLESWLEDNQAASTPHLCHVKVIMDLPCKNPARVQRLNELTNKVRVGFELE